MTVENLLRHVKIRQASEVPLLLEDNRDLEDVLAKLSNNLTAHPRLSGVLKKGLDEIQLCLQNTPAIQQTMPTAISLDQRSDELRKVLDELLKALSAIRKQYSGDDTYRVSRRQIREYISRSLQREGQLITPAFTGGRR